MARKLKSKPSSKLSTSRLFVEKMKGLDDEAITIDQLEDKVRHSGYPGVVSTQTATFDAALGIGGLPLGRHVLVGGGEGAGKTTFGLHLCAEVIRMGGGALYIDAEHKLDQDYAATIVRRPKELLVMRPPYIERGATKIKEFISVLEEHRREYGPVPGIVVVDSTSAWPSKKEYECEDENYTMGGQAAAMSTFLRAINPRVVDSHILMLWLSQVREKIGGLSFGPSTDYTSGWAIKFYPTIVARLIPVAKIERGGKYVGRKVMLHVEKNQVAPPFRKATTDLIFGQGYDTPSSYLDRAVELKLAKRKGSWYSVGDERCQRGAVVKQLGKSGMKELMRRVREADAQEHNRV